MIPDEQIKQLAVSCGFKLTNETGDDLKPYVYEFAGDVIALAQQVKPLVWTDLKHITGKKAETCFGNYYVSKIDALPYRTVYIGEGEFDYADTEAEAISAANEDYRKRVLSCLVWGVV